MADESLILLIKEVRDKTFRQLRNVTEEQARFAAPGLKNTILWHAGHRYVVNERLALAPATRQPPCEPADWFEMFSWESDPAKVTNWPTLAEVLAKLHEQLPRYLAAVEQLTTEELNTIVFPDYGWTLRFGIVHALHDEANHQGEVWLLKKIYEQTHTPSK